MFVSLLIYKLSITNHKMPKGQKKSDSKVTKSYVDIMPPGTPKGFIPAGRAGRSLTVFQASDSEKEKLRVQEQEAEAQRKEVQKQKDLEQKKRETQIALNSLMRHVGGCVART